MSAKIIKKKVLGMYKQNQSGIKIFSYTFSSAPFGKAAFVN